MPRLGGTEDVGTHWAPLRNASDSRGDGLDDYGGAARRGDDDVGAQAGLTGDGLGVFGTHLAAGHHVLEQTAEGVIGIRLRLAGHTTL